MSDQKPDSAGLALTEVQLRQRRRRSIALGAVIGGLVLLFYLITVFRMAPSLLQKAV